MKINEFTNPLPLFVATVRAKTASSTSNLEAAIYAEGPSQAQQLLRASYGDGSVVSVNLSEAESAKPLTPDQRLAASKNEQAERARGAENGYDSESARYGFDSRRWYQKSDLSSVE